MKIFGRKKRVFLDYASATPVLAKVEKEMRKFWSEDFYNPSAIYNEGRSAKNFTEDCRKRIAKVLSVGSRDIIFTSGGTESDNLALLGTFEIAKEKFEHPHLIISAIEHPAVSEAAKEVKRLGGEVSVAQVDENGRVSAQDLEKLLKPNTYLVSIMYANNEIGTVEPIGKIARIVREYRKKNESEYPYFHTDASQAPNYLSMNLEGLNVDLATLDSGKIYGPKGIGTLVVRPNVRIRPKLMGGGQEKGLRSGTENTALIAGFAKALEIAISEREKENGRLSSLKGYLIAEVKQRFGDSIEINADTKNTLSSIVSISVPEALSEMILLKLEKEGFLVSTGSSCSSNGNENGSPVIRAIGKPGLAESTIRISIGRFTTKKDIERLLPALEKALLRG